MSEQLPPNPENHETENSLQRLKDIASSILSAESREYLDQDLGWSAEAIQEITFYIVGELQNEGYDFEEVFEQAGITIEFDPEAPYIDE